TNVPGPPIPGAKSSIIGAGPMTRKSFVVTATPAGVITVIGPFVAPKGTVAWICVAAVTPNVALLLLNSTFVVPTKLKPMIVTLVLVAPRVGLSSVMRGATVKLAMLLPAPVGLVTRIGPVVASTGTVATI